LKRSVQVILLVLLILAVDQTVKIWVKTHMCIGGEPITILGLKWAQLNFVENPGMAFGITLGGNYGKLILSLFRLFAIGFLIYYIRNLIKINAPKGLVLGFSSILAGAIGNVLDSLFYGLIFSTSDPSAHHWNCVVAKMFPPEGGYGTFLHGKVVDMFYFPMGHFPNWVPFLGGRMFFEPVFNVADSAITLGVVSILLFQRAFFNELPENTAPAILPNPPIETLQTIDNQVISNPNTNIVTNHETPPTE
jgi:signal peptidase II